MNLVYNSTFTVFPQDCNYLIPPMVFGGKVLSEMDVCAAMACRRLLYGTECTDSVTVQVDKVTFFVGAVIGDLVFLRGEIVKLGHKSIVIHVEGERENHDGKRERICCGDFTFVSRKNGKSHPHGLKLNDD